MDDMALLREYATSNSEAAFETLVSRRVNFVYSAALRQVRDPHLAKEITQAVFIILAQKAGRISDKTILAGWLFRTTRFAALAQMRAAAKRQQREQEAQMQSPLQPAAPDGFWTFNLSIAGNTTRIKVSSAIVVSTRVSSVANTSEFATDIPALGVLDVYAAAAVTAVASVSPLAIAAQKAMSSSTACKFAFEI